MTWNFYNFENPAYRDRDEVRSLCGDRVPNQPYTLSDEEIDLYLLRWKGDVNLAAIDACEAFEAMYSSQADQSDGEQSTSFSQRAEAYVKRAAHIRSKIGARCRPFAMTTQAQRDAAEADRALIPRIFVHGQFDND